MLYSIYFDPKRQVTLSLHRFELRQALFAQWRNVCPDAADIEA